MNRFKKYFIFLSVVVLSFSIFQLNQSPTTKVLTINENKIFTLTSRSLTFQPMLIAPYKSMDIFISEEQSPGFNFSSVGGYWDEISPENTAIEFQVKFKTDGQWGQWLDLEEEKDPLYPNEAIKKKYAMASTDHAQATKYRLIIYGDGKSSPVVKNLSWTFIKAEKNLELEQIPAPKFSNFAPLSNSTYLALTAGVSGVISRSQWGADESYRFLADNNENPELIELDPDFYEKYKDELQYSRTIEADQNGNKYKWPLNYPKKVSKFVIHHTATTANLENPEQAIRDIYYYHAITRGWGDIGYNYIVDQDGKIYEGRYGGEGVIGAHSGPGNHGSIGIAVLGNFQDKPVSEKIINGLSDFINAKAKIHNIKVDGSSKFRGEIKDNVLGHRDIMSTQCPGEFLYAKLPIIRYLASQEFNQKKKFVKDYDYQNAGDLYYIELKPFENREISLVMENIGIKDWDQNTYLVVDQNEQFNDVISFPTKKDAVLAKMTQTLVKSGEKATFKFQLQGGKKGKTVYLQITPIINGTYKPTDYFTLPLTVEQPIYKYEVISSTPASQLLKINSQFDFSVKLKNKGNVPWKNSGDSKIVLKSTVSKLTGELVQNEVQPEEIGEFKINLTMPSKGGKFSEDLVAYIEGAKFSLPEKIEFSTNVYEREYDAEIISQTPINTLEKGKTYEISVTLANIGSKTWKKDNLDLAVVRSQDISISNLQISLPTIKPSEFSYLTFKAKISADAKLEKNTIFVRPRVDGNPLTRLPVIFNYEIVEAKAEPKKENLKTENKKIDKTNSKTSSTDQSIRVKISFSGEPQITGNGSFDIYSAENFITTLNTGEIASVKKEDGKYHVKANELSFLKDKPIRFIPKDETILKIENFNHAPAWNPALNDNEYRGILEVRDIDNTMTVINELPLEDYLKGLAEISNDEKIEKIKAIVVAARTYAKYYTTTGQKFPGKPYNLDDNPEVSQKYLGYGFEKRAPYVVASVQVTEGEVITYNGKVVITPYFSQSDGTKTKSAKEVWKWDNTPYLISVDDSSCSGDKFLGHGVGLSGCGAKGLAEKGFDYQQILKHYYTGVEITDLY